MGITGTLGLKEIQEIIPHRPPFLFVDEVLELEPGIRAVGIKHISPEEPFFTGHFPGYPVMPGVLIVEAIAQVGAIALLSKAEYRGRLALFAGIDAFRFRDQVRPGQVMRLETSLLWVRHGVGKGHGLATVAGKPVAEGELSFVVR
ncbi:MAG TPA: 3-hydroxyacyl-ACP dehydratase FabZ [Firmicutes bacterium]|nr:3-hydroxyacyl-ACP dehydratase FabZ [Bacillota bacterium]